jgi:hypothetical protein
MSKLCPMTSELVAKSSRVVCVLQEQAGRSYPKAIVVVVLWLCDSIKEPYKYLIVFLF